MEDLVDSSTRLIVKMIYGPMTELSTTSSSFQFEVR